MCNSGGARRPGFPAKRPIFYYITDRRQLPEGALPRVIRRAAAWGADFVQIREKDLADRDLLRLASAAVRATAGTGCKVLVNGRADIAVAAGAAGVHLAASGLRAEDLIPWIPEDFVVGVSTHSLREARRAAAGGADYVLLSPIFETPSKIHFGSPLGLRYLRRACSTLTIPVIGLGGIRWGSVAPVLDAGAAGVAGIRLFQLDLHSRLKSGPPWQVTR